MCNLTYIEKIADNKYQVRLRVGVREFDVGPLWENESLLHVEHYKNQLDSVLDSIQSEGSWQADRVETWVRNKARKAANLAFTEGPERNVCYAVEDLLALLKPGEDIVSRLNTLLEDLQYARTSETSESIGDVYFWRSHYKRVAEQLAELMQDHLIRMKSLTE